MDKNNAQELLNKYLNGECTPSEKRIIESWYNQAIDEQGASIQDADFEFARTRIFNNLPHKRPPRLKRMWLPYAAAAVIVVTLGAGLFFYNPNKIPVYANDVKPGSNKAILTLASGKQIVLTDAHTGMVAEQGNTAIKKTADGSIVYDGDKISSTKGLNGGKEPQFNTIATPRGGQYRVTLSDGSLVLLNAASSIKYPAVFTGNVRQVELIGEAYFEVAHNKAKPFIVKTGTEQVQVLGTHFNVNAYNDEDTQNTTLLEGSVKVSAGSSAAMLVPGQQSVLAYRDNKIKVQTADIETTIAWKNGDFVFKEESLASIMRKVSRWYDVDVVYNNSDTKQITLGGWVSRSKNISSVLKIMELTGKVHFKVEGRRITVM